MALTNPGGLSNSSSKPFSNVFGRIAKDNFNILEGSQSLYDFNSKNNKKQSNGIRYPNYQPKNVNQVILSTQVGN
jgi:hypothetical protein